MTGNEILSGQEWVDFRAVKAEISMEAVLRHYGLGNLRRQGRQCRGPCPIHGGRRQDSFCVNLTRNVFQCFSCQAKGTVLDLVAALESCSLREAALRLQAWFDPSLTLRCRTARYGSLSVSTRPDQAERVRKKEVGNPALGFRLRGVDGTHAYLRQRGIDRATAAEFGVGFYSGPGLMRGRIVIPIANEQGEIVAYAGRALGKELPKYKLPAGFQKAHELFNLHRALAQGNRRVILVEGYFDCMKVHQAGFSHVVALMGCSLSAWQAQRLGERFEHVTLMLDGDQTGRGATQTIRHQLPVKLSSLTIQLPDETQPDQLSSSEIQLLLSGMPK